MASVDAQEELTKLLAVTSRKELADWFGISDKALRYVLYGLSDAERYTSFEIAKRGGGKRTISAPIGRLSVMQKKLAPVLSAASSPHQIAVAYVPGRSLVDGAMQHRRKRWVATVDLKDFFPSVNFGRIRGIFLAKPFCLPSDVATLLAQICARDDGLPQGAPTSPALSNIACVSLDAKLIRFARRHRLSVTRYADDICFSSNGNDPSAVVVREAEGERASVELEKLIQSAGFQVNDTKTRLSVRDERKVVTGLVVNESINMPRRWRRQTRVMHNLFRKYGDEDGAAMISKWELKRPGPRSSLQAVLQGRFHFVRSLEKTSGSAFSVALGRAYWASSPFLRVALSPVEMLVGVEGVTDKMYLDAALVELQSMGQFRGIKPTFVSKDGDVKLRNWIEEVSRYVSDRDLSVALFDCDSSDPAVKKLCAAPGGVSRIGGIDQPVFAAVIPAPRAGVSEYCIEHYFDDSVLARRSLLGRRIFRKEEFDDRTRIHVKERCFCSSRKGSLIIDDDVYSMDDGAPVAMSKKDFCTSVVNRMPPFSDVSLGVFRPIFELLEDLSSKR